ncbi:RNA polymerase sigma factor SigY [Bacillus sp. 179-C3.3 HS]|uniref:RNA polymerase sigma factor SigY n=1 Tax=Bacillus sp. 179-C3.3 HS TaxID=3232162 RepID=UPI0039A32F4C
MEQVDEALLIKQAKQGDDAAFTALYREYYSFVYRYLIKLTLHQELTEELMQETMLKAYMKLSTFRGDSLFSTWLISIASRQFLDHQKKRKREQLRENRANQEAIRRFKWDVEQRGHTWHEMWDTLHELKAQERAPIILHYYYGFTYPEIASMLDMREGTVKSRVHHGLKKIRKEWLL